MKKTATIISIFLLISVYLVWLWSTSNKDLNPEIKIGLETDKNNIINLAPQAAKPEQFINFNSKILRISFDHPSNWGTGNESINESNLKTPYQHWVSGLDSELRFETITEDITPFGYEGPEAFKFTHQNIEQLCDTLDFVNLKNLENPKVDCQLKFNSNNIAYIKYKISFHFSYESGMDFIVDGMLLKTKSEKFPLLAIYYERYSGQSLDGQDQTYIKALRDLNTVTTSLTYE